MALSSSQLEAFVAVAKYKSFSQAAQHLHVTQSALSQRILNLEEEIEANLFVRESSGLRLTQTGGDLLKYCHIKDSLEEEFLLGLKSKNKGELSGSVRIGSFSSHARSVLLPKLGELNKIHPKVNAELLVREIRELPSLLKSGQADYIFTTTKLESQGIINELVGFEENVLIEARAVKNIKDVYIDHDEFDNTTQNYFKIQKSAPKNYKRLFFDEIYSIIDAVEHGLGRAVVPRHLIEHNKKIVEVSKQKVLEVPIYFTYYEQVFYTEMQKELVRFFLKDMPGRLK